MCVSKEPGSAVSDAMLLWWCDSGDSDENLIWETDESKNGYKHISCRPCGNQYDVSHGGCFIKFVYGDTDLCVNALGGKHFQDGDAFGLFDCTYTKQEELQFMGTWLPTTIEMSATPAQLQMAPSHCVGKSGKCNPPNGDKVVGDDTWSEIEWTRV